MQVGFIGGICLPCYDLLVQVLPATAPMQENCKDNLNIWKEKADERRRELESKTDEQLANPSDRPAPDGDDLKMESQDESLDSNWIGGKSVHK